jgi:hypothetical protein
VFVMEVFVVEGGYKCSAAYATQDSNGIFRRDGSSATKSAFVPTMCNIVSGARFALSS